MFNFDTTTIINANVDVTTGKPLWSSSADPGNMFVKRHLNFLKDNVLAIWKKDYSEPIKATITFDVSSCVEEEGIYRIALYLRLSGAISSVFANGMFVNGKPIYIEFTKKKDEMAGDIAKRIVKTFNKHMLALYDTNLFEVKASDTKVIFTAINEYVQVQKADVEKFVSAGCGSCAGVNGEFEVVESATLATDPEHDSKNILVQGKEGFGTYNHLMKDYRLPTMENTGWGSRTAHEAPVAGAKYNQYTIRYCVDRGVMGTDAVGDTTKSITTHVFFVNKDVAAEFETALAHIGEVKEA